MTHYKRILLRVPDEDYEAFKAYLIRRYGKINGYQNAEIVRAIKNLSTGR